MEELLKVAVKYRMKRLKLGEIEIDIDTFIAAAEAQTPTDLDERVQQKLKLEDLLKQEKEDLMWST